MKQIYLTNKTTAGYTYYTSLTVKEFLELFAVEDESYGYLDLDSIAFILATADEDAYERMMDEMDEREVKIEEAIELFLSSASNDVYISFC